MSSNTAELAAKWDLDGFVSVGGNTFNDLHKKLTYLEQSHYSQYVPTSGVDYLDYDARLATWIESTASESDRRLLFEFAASITFFTREDFTKLYQTAVAGPISRWLVDLLGWPFQDPALSSKITNALDEGTWYCPLSDSMPIADFHHANRLGGIQLRPDWRSLVALAERQRFEEFLANQSPAIERIVILEDFIGAGWQLKGDLRPETSTTGIVNHNAVSFAGSIPTISFLFVPLIVCPVGASELRRLAAPFANVTVAPVLELAETELVPFHSGQLPETVQSKICDLAQRLEALVTGAGTGSRPYGPFGNGGTGARVVMYSNTPAGTLPIIHHQSDSWNPLFPRSARP